MENIKTFIKTKSKFIDKVLGVTNYVFFDTEECFFNNVAILYNTGSKIKIRRCMGHPDHKYIVVFVRVKNSYCETFENTFAPHINKMLENKYGEEYIKVRNDLFNIAFGATEGNGGKE